MMTAESVLISSTRELPIASESPRLEKARSRSRRTLGSLMVILPSEMNILAKVSSRGALRRAALFKPASFEERAALIVSRSREPLPALA